MLGISCLAVTTCAPALVALAESLIGTVAFEEAAHRVVFCGVLVGYEPVVHGASLPFVELPAEELLVEFADLGWVRSGYFEVYNAVEFRLRLNNSCC